ncbi:hypothetical protein [Rhodocyclus tenuis]|uniref:ElaB/YqjD/DUF883 family membrane-anchored ribosome-binding protein n=1 Tax=Rhodocyclus tenuis TaxID=1066 RepID=A0A840GHB9_RHOTE|nr:hypothetical protein [Rhodocyclus tenuis]MBB4247579.1 ElaB/YqjD/DUF883 family membrane-anchored ribosome-binding protein [Rhodocyclus tenuis]
MQEGMDESRQKERFTSKAFQQFEARERELLEYRELIQKQEKQLDEYRTRLKHEQMAREQELQKELESREKYFADRERKLFARQKEIEHHLMKRQEEAEALRTKLEHELSSREAQLQDALQQLNLEKERYTEESRKKIERTSKDYVSDTLSALDKKEVQFHLISKIWSAIGAVSLAGGLGFFGYVTISSFASIPNPITWEFITFSIFKGLIALALFAALAKYAFLFSNSYMREALKNADRRHAINFGKFYLESYGAAAEWTQIKEAFENWNIIGTNAFSTPDESQLDVTALEKVANTIEKIRKSLPASKSETSA